MGGCFDGGTRGDPRLASARACRHGPNGVPCSIDTALCDGVDPPRLGDREQFQRGTTRLLFATLPLADELLCGRSDNVRGRPGSRARAGGRRRSALETATRRVSGRRHRTRASSPCPAVQRDAIRRRLVDGSRKMAAGPRRPGTVMGHCNRSPSVVRGADCVIRRLPKKERWVTASPPTRPTSSDLERGGITSPTSRHGTARQATNVAESGAGSTRADGAPRDLRFRASW